MMRALKLGGFMFLIFLGIVFVVLSKVIPAKLESSRQNDPGFSLRPGKTVLGLVGFLMLVYSVFSSSYYEVPAGFRGVLLQQGAVSSTLGEGPHIVLPYFQEVQLMEVRTRREDSQATAASKDLQVVNTSVAINYHLDPSQAGYVFKTLGHDYNHRIIDQRVAETVKAVMAGYTAEELVTKRPLVKSEVDSRIIKQLSDYHIVVEPDGISLTNFQFSEQFNAAIETKQEAQQKAEQQKYELQKAQMAAQTAIAQAKGEAEANRLKAQALNAQGGSKVLAREWIDKWDGHVPTVVSGSGGMMLNLQDLISKQDVSVKNP